MMISGRLYSSSDGCEIIPQQVICEQCGATLYNGLDLKPPDEILQEHDGKCPKCGKKLSFTPKKIEVKPLE
jgi:DNA-directed RNA polymerase subunit RPC12/RpoP